MSTTEILFVILVIFAILCSIAAGVLIRYVLKQAEQEEREEDV